MSGGCNPVFQFVAAAAAATRRAPAPPPPPPQHATAEQSLQSKKRVRKKKVEIFSLCSFAHARQTAESARATRFARRRNVLFNAALNSGGSDGRNRYGRADLRRARWQRRRRQRRAATAATVVAVVQHAAIVAAVAFVCIGARAQPACFFFAVVALFAVGVALANARASAAAVAFVRGRL